MEISSLSEKVEDKGEITLAAHKVPHIQIVLAFLKSSVGKTVKFRKINKAQASKKVQKTEEMHF